MLGARGKKVLVLHRIVKNDRMAAVGYLWSFAALRLSTGARAHYDRRGIAGDRHAATQRQIVQSLPRLSLLVGRQNLTRA